MLQRVNSPSQRTSAGRRERTPPIGLESTARRDGSGRAATSSAKRRRNAAAAPANRDRVRPSRSSSFRHDPGRAANRMPSGEASRRRPVRERTDDARSRRRRFAPPYVTAHALHPTRSRHARVARRGRLDGRCRASGRPARCSRSRRCGPPPRASSRSPKRGLAVRADRDAVQVLGSAIWGGYTYALRSDPRLRAAGHALDHVSGSPPRACRIVRRARVGRLAVAMIVATA